MISYYVLLMEEHTTTWKVIMVWILSPQKHMLKSLGPQNVTIFGDEDFKEVIQLKWSH